MSAENEKFVLAIAALAAAFNRDVDQAVFKAYRWGTEGMSIEAIESACADAIRTCEWMPSPAALRELGGELSPKSVGLLAWESFCQAVRKHGGNMTVDFDDKTINAVIRSLGGWQEVTLVTTEEMHKWIRQKFLDAYERFRKLRLDGEMTLPLIGELDSNNAFWQSEPIHIECLSTKESQEKIANTPDEVQRLSQSMALHYLKK